MNEPVDWNLLAKYLFGECSEEEAAHVKAWLEADPGRHRLLAELQEIVERQAKQPRSERDVDALWNRLEECVERDERGIEPARRGAASNGKPHPRPAPARTRSRDAKRTRRSSRRRRRSTSRRIMRVAAPMVLVGLCAVLATLWVGDGTPTQSAEAEPKVFATERGQRAMVRLGDGTLARLNAASTLTVSPSFGTERRSVQLEGEAYFEVAHDARRPFIVRTRGTTTRVLGTAFDVSAYPEDEQVRVVVTDGTVEVEAEAIDAGREKIAREGADERGEEGASGAESSAQRVVLTARQMVTLEASGRMSRHQAADVERYLAWMDGELHFEDASFQEVARSVERWYNIEIVIDESAVPAGHLNARFPEQEALSEVLNVIAATFGLDVELRARTARFYPERTDPPE